MGKGLTRSRAKGAKNPNQVAWLRQNIAVSKSLTNVDGATGDGWDTVVIGDLPEGNILFSGAVAYLTFTKTTGGVTATWTGAYSIGTTPTADATLATTDANIVGSSAISAAVAGVTASTRGTGVTAAILDNTDNSLELNLNLKVDDATISADDQTITVVGEVSLIYAVLLDD